MTVGFETRRVRRVVRETADAVSLVFDLDDRAAYQAGQFVTVRVTVAGESHLRCYSMSSSPALDDELRVTVKGVSGGVVSTWLNAAVAEGDELEVSPPAGTFVLGTSPRDIVAFAGGSGITPVFSILRTALATTDRQVRLLYANRDRESVIFDAALDALVADYPGRLTVEHHIDDDRGFVGAAHVEGFLADGPDADFYVCGPAPFMDTIEDTLLAKGVRADRVHLERFVLADLAEEDRAGTATTEEVTFEVDRRTSTVKYRQGDTLLQIVRASGARAPSSCEIGSCGTCIAQIKHGSARMLNNEILEPDEVADGLILTCQALPTSPSIHFVYE